MRRSVYFFLVPSWSSFKERCPLGYNLKIIWRKWRLTLWGFWDVFVLAFNDRSEVNGCSGRAGNLDLCIHRNFSKSDQILIFILDSVNSRWELLDFVGILLDYTKRETNWSLAADSSHTDLLNVQVIFQHNLLIQKLLITDFNSPWSGVDAVYFVAERWELHF